MQDHYEQVNQKAHSVLFRIPAVEAEQEDTEALSSLTMRLADAHSMAATSLFNVIQTYTKTGIEEFKQLGKRLDGLNKTTMAWLPAIEALTMQFNLISLTFLTWINILTSMSLRTNTAWCPECYTEFLQTKGVLYNPLIWRVVDYEYCVKHQRPLETKCPFPDCEKAFSVLPGVGGIGFCPHCSRYLLAYQKQSTVGIADREVLARSAFVRSFLMASIPSEMTASSLSKTLFQIAHDKTGLKRNDIVSATNYDPGNRNRREKETGKMSLRFISDLALFGDITVQEIQETHADLLRSPNSEIRRLPETIRINRRKQFMNILDESLNSSDNPPKSLAAIANEFGVEAKGLYRVSPSKCKKIIQRYRDYREQQILIELEQTLDSALHEKPPTAIIEIVKAYKFKSSKYIQKRFSDKYTKLINQWNEYYEITHEMKLEKASVYFERLFAEPAAHYPSVDYLADELNLNVRFIISNFPNETETLVKFRKEASKTHWLKIESSLLEFMKQDLPPTLRQICKDLSIRRDDLNKRFPSHCRQITEQRRKQLLILLEADLLNIVGQDRVPPPSISFIAKQLRTSATFIKKHFPNLYSQLSQNYKEYCENQKANRALDLKRMINDDSYEIYGVVETAEILLIHRKTFKSNYPEEHKFIYERHQMYLQKHRKEWELEIEAQLRTSILDLHNRGIKPSLSRVKKATGFWIKRDSKQRKIYDQILNELGY